MCTDDSALRATQSAPARAYVHPTTKQCTVIIVRHRQIQERGEDHGKKEHDNLMRINRICQNWLIIVIF